MKFLSNVLRVGLAGWLLAAMQACSHQSTELPQPTPVSATALTSEVSVAEAKAWYQATYPTTFASATPAAANAPAVGKGESTFGRSQLLWKRAVAVGQGAQQRVLVPISSDPGVTGKNWQGLRYLIAYKSGSQQISANVMEILLRRNSTPIDTVALLTELCNNQGKSMSSPGQKETYALLYSADYKYLSGRHFEGNQVLPENSRLVFFPSAASKGAKTLDACIDWYCLETGQYITTTGDCGNVVQGGDPTMPGGGGGTSGPGDYGGGGGGGSSTGGFPSVPTTSANVQQQTPTLSNYAATLTIVTSLYQVINVLVELDTNNHDLKKVTVTLNGVVWYVKVNQIGDGTLISYNAATDTYTFSVTYQKVLGDIWSSQTTLTGTISPSRGVGTLRIP